jgi:hypothetical protein
MLSGLRSVQEVPLENVHRSGQTKIVDELLSVNRVAKVVASRRDIVGVLRIPVHILKKVTEASLCGERGDALEVVTNLAAI